MSKLIDSLEIAFSNYAQFKFEKAIEQYTQYLNEQYQHYQSLYQQLSASLSGSIKDLDTIDTRLLVPSEFVHFSYAAHFCTEQLPQLEQIFQSAIDAKQQRAKAYLCNRQLNEGSVEIASLGINQSYGLDRLTDIPWWNGEAINGKSVLFIPPLSLTEELFFSSFYQCCFGKVKSAAVLHDKQVLPAWFQYGDNIQFYELNKRIEINTLNESFDCKMHTCSLLHYHNEYGLELEKKQVQPDVALEVDKLEQALLLGSQGKRVCLKTNFPVWQSLGENHIYAMEQVAVEYV